MGKRFGKWRPGNWAGGDRGAAPEVMPPEFLCVFNFGGRVPAFVTLYQDLLTRGVSETVPLMGVTLEPGQERVVRQILHRALQDVAAVVRGERFVGHGG